MANTRIRDISLTATVPAGDDYIAIDGTTNLTRRMLLGTMAAQNSNAVTITGGTISATTLRALNNLGGYQAVIGQATGGDRVGIAGQASGGGTGFVFFDVTESVFRPSTFDASLHSFKIGGATALRLTGITSATDYLEIKNGIGVGTPIHVLAEGASANIGVHLQPKGTGLFTISDGTDFNKGIRFRSSSSAASAVTLIDAVSTAGRVVTLPDATGTLLYGGGPLGTPSSGTVTNLTGTASININGTVGATTRNTVAATTGNFQASGGAPIILTGNASAQIQIGGTGATDPSIRYDAAGVLGVVTADQSAYAKIRALDFQGTVGATSPSTGAFTTLTTLAGAVAATGDATALTVRQAGDGGVAMLFTNSVANLVRLSGTVASAGAGTDDGIFVVQTATDGTLTERARFSATGLSVTGALSATGALAIGNTVATAVAVASTHKVTIVIGGVTYYLLATNV